MKKAAILLFALYFVIGIFIANDYGMCWDEWQERETSVSNYVYVTGEAMRSSEHDSVRNLAEKTPDLMTYKDRFYGTALQNITVFFEHLRNFKMTTREVFVMRHIFTFINYFVAGICFYLILKRRFGDTFIPLLGVLFYILFPRFFGESFYNIKDILFYSWNVISAYFILRWLEPKSEAKRQGAFLFPAAASIAVATNTRILGVSLLMLAVFFIVVQGIRQQESLAALIKKPLALTALTFVFYVLITPFVWKNPLKNTIDIFFIFLTTVPWNGTHFYMGEQISREVPWHYIPVWMGLTVPILYIIMFFAGVLSVIIKRAKNLHIYDLFFFALFFCTLFGYIFLHINMYEGWRHAYGIFFPFLYMAVYGIYRSFEFLSNKKKIFRRGFIGVVAGCLGYLLVWTALNHPYQYAYFNIIGRQFAEKNFTLDYWEISHTDLIRYALKHDDRPTLSFSFSSWFITDIRTEEEKQRVRSSGYDVADYYLQNTRMSYDERDQHSGYEEFYAITVDGMKISTLFKRVEPEAAFDNDSWGKIANFESISGDDYTAMYDGNNETFWGANRGQAPGDYMSFEFSEPVDYNFVHLGTGGSKGDFSRDLSIFVSLDGNNWNAVLVKEIIGQCYYRFESEDYKFLKFVNNASNDCWWKVYKIEFGHYLEK